MIAALEPDIYDSMVFIFCYCCFFVDLQKSVETQTFDNTVQKFN